MSAKYGLICIFSMLIPSGSVLNGQSFERIQGYRNQKQLPRHLDPRQPPAERLIPPLIQSKRGLKPPVLKSAPKYRFYRSRWQWREKLPGPWHEWAEPTSWEIAREQAVTIIAPGSPRKVGNLFGEIKLHEAEVQGRVREIREKYRLPERRIAP